MERKLNWDDIEQKLRVAASDDAICGMSYLDAAKALLEEGKRTENPRYLGTAWYSLAVQQSEDAHSADKGAEYLTLALEQAKLSGDYELINSSYILMGQLLRSQRVYSQALEYFMQAACAGKRCPNPAWCEGRANVEIAILYHQIGENKLALQSMQSALRNMAPQTGQIHYERHMMSIHILLGHWYLDTEMDTVSCAHEIQILKENFRGGSIWQKEHYDVRLLCLEIHLASCVGTTNEMHQMVDEVLPMMQEAIDDTRIVEDLIRLFSLMIREERYDACSVLSEMALKVSRDCLPGIRSQLYELLIRYYDSCGMTQERSIACYEYYLSMQEQQRDERQILVLTMHRQQERGQVQEENRRLAQEAQTDELTGLPNRYGMNAAASSFYESCYRERIPFGFEVIDVDFFKEYNDTYGHQAGDAVLQNIARILLRLHKDNPDIYPARYGGDEMVVLYRGMHNEEIEEITRELDAQVRSLAMEHKNSHSSRIVTISQGVVNAVPVNATRLWDYMSSADRALYEVKRRSKGSWRIVSEITTAEDKTRPRQIALASAM